MKTVAIIDDDVYIGDMLEELLQKEGYGVLRAYSGTEALLLLDKSSPDVILLDLMLPGISGEDVLTRIKGIPTLVISAKTDIDSKVRLLLGGAADYITKPFDTKELLARISVQLRRGCEPERTLSSGEISLNLNARTAYVKGNELHLTRTEYAILKLLMQNPSQAIAKSTILDRISFDTPDCTESSLKVHISNLRQKLREASGRDYIDSVWGIGFRFVE